MEEEMKVVGTQDYNPESQANKLLRLRDNLDLYYPIEIDLKTLDGSALRDIKYKQFSTESSGTAKIKVEKENAEMIAFDDNQFYWKGHSQIDAESGMVKVYKLEGFQYKNYTGGQLSFYIHASFLLFVQKDEKVEFNQVSFIESNYFAKFIPREATHKTLAEYNRLVAVNDYFGDNFSDFVLSGDISFHSLQTLNVNTSGDTQIDLRIALSQRVRPPAKVEFENISVGVTALKCFYDSGASGDITKTIMGQISVLLGPIVDLGTDGHSSVHMGASLPGAAISGAKLAVTSAVKVIPKVSKKAVILSGKAKGALVKLPGKAITVITGAGKKTKEIVVTPQGAAASITAASVVISTGVVTRQANKGRPIQPVK